MISTALHFLVGIAVVGAMLWGAAVAARRFGARGEGRGPVQEGLRIVARRPISKNATLVRVSVEDRDILLGASPKGLEVICDLPKTATVEARSTSPSFPAPARLVGNRRRAALTSGRGADSAGLLPGLQTPGQGGFSAILQSALLRRRSSQQV